MPKKKLQRFAEIKTFPNVFEPSLEEVRQGHYFMKGKWNREFFRNNNPVIIELGCGKGEYTIGQAEKYPHKNFIGIDIKGARIWRGAKTAIEKKLGNVAFLRTRIEFIDSFFDKDEVEEIWITFPDPQPQKPRERKRLTALRFLNLYKKFLPANGVVHLKTDNNGLYEYTRQVIGENHFALLESTDDLYSSPGVAQHPEATSIKTHYESIFREKGSKICYLKFQIG